MFGIEMCENKSSLKNTLINCKKKLIWKFWKKSKNLQIKIKKIQKVKKIIKNLKNSHKFGGLFLG